MNYSRGKGDTFGGNGHFLVINDHFWVINDHFGGPSVHCGQILQKNPGKGQSPTPLSGNARILGAYGPPAHP